MEKPIEQTMIGCIICFRFDTWLARNIRSILRIWGRITGSPQKPTENHTEKVTHKKNGRYYCTGADWPRVRRIALDKLINSKNVSGILVLRPVKPITEQEIYCLQQMAEFYTDRKTPYQWVNFLQWLVYVFTFGMIWPGRRYKKSDRNQYCFENTARLTNAHIPMAFPDPEITSIQDIKGCNDFCIFPDWRNYILTIIP